MGRHVPPARGCPAGPLPPWIPWGGNGGQIGGPPWGGLEGGLGAISTRIGGVGCPGDGRVELGRGEGLAKSQLGLPLFSIGVTELKYAVLSRFIKLLGNRVGVCASSSKQVSKQAT